jgi:isoleucyl-tRNA synthetase
VWLDTRVTPELERAGLVREIIRAINQIRKEQNFTLKDLVTIEYHTGFAALKDAIESNKEEIARATLASKIIESHAATQPYEISGAEVKFRFTKQA